MNGDTNSQQNPNDPQGQNTVQDDLQNMVQGGMPGIPQIQPGSMPLPTFGADKNKNRISIGSPETGYISQENGPAGKTESRTEYGDAPLQENKGETGREQGMEFAPEKTPDLRTEELKQIEAKDRKPLQPQQTPVIQAPAVPAAQEPEKELTFPKIAGYPIPEIHTTAEIKELGANAGANSANLALSIFLEKLLRQEASENQS